MVFTIVEMRAIGDKWPGRVLAHAACCPEIQFPYTTVLWANVCVGFGTVDDSRLQSSDSSARGPCNILCAPHLFSPSWAGV